jgi:hypothetical protein
MAKSKAPPVRGQSYAGTKTTGNRVFKSDPKPGGSLAISPADAQALPILRNTAKEKELVKYIMDRVKLSDEERKRRSTRAQNIDVQLSGFIALSKDDMKRKQANESGKSPKPTDHNLPLAEAQLDEAVTYLMSVYAPEMDIFEAVAPADKQKLAKALTTETNKQSQKGQYYRHFAKALLNSLKYNFAGITCYWEKQTGLKFVAEPGGTVSKKIDTIWEGNVLASVDIYNFFYDTSVHPVDLPMLGEFFATCERKTPFRVRKMAQDKQLFGINRYVEELFGDGMRASDNVNSFYIEPPSVRDEQNGASSNKTNWAAMLRATGEDTKESVPGIEFVHYVGWINPKSLGLNNDDKLQLWRITVANSKYITFAVKLEDTHGMLPIAMACPSEDDLKTEQRSHAEKLIPLQHFASFLLNAHQAATRKAIYGISVFNQNLFPGLDKDNDELIGALIPFRSTSTDIDIDKAFRHYNASPGTEQNVQQIGEILQIMQKILPTDLARQVADLERATKYQAAATVQAGNRRQLKIARIIHDQCISVLKFQILYNIYANMTSLSYIDPAGQRVDIPISDCVAAEVEYDISTGLKGLDRLMMLEIMKDVVNGILQSQQGIAEIDIVKLLDYYFSLAGDRTDLNQFRKAPPVAGQPGAAQAQPPNGGQMPNP